MGEFILGKLNYWMYAALLLIGLYGMMAKRNLMKKLIGLSIFQTAIMLFYISAGAKKGGSLPILMEGNFQVASYVNPLPHVLILTAIVVMVSTTGVALAVILLVYRRYKTLEEDEILKSIR